MFALRGRLRVLRADGEVPSEAEDASERGRPRGFGGGDGHSEAGALAEPREEDAPGRRASRLLFGDFPDTQVRSGQSFGEDPIVRVALDELH